MCLVCLSISLLLNVGLALLSLFDALLIEKPLKIRWLKGLEMDFPGPPLLPLWYSIFIICWKISLSLSLSFHPYIKKLFCCRVDLPYWVNCINYWPASNVAIDVQKHTRVWDFLVWFSNHLTKYLIGCNYLSIILLSLTNKITRCNIISLEILTLKACKWVLYVMARWVLIWTLKWLESLSMCNVNLYLLC